MNVKKLVQMHPHYMNYDHIAVTMIPLRSFT